MRSFFLILSNYYLKWHKYTLIYILLLFLFVLFVFILNQYQRLFEIELDRTYITVLKLFQVAHACHVIGYSILLLVCTNKINVYDYVIQPLSISTNNTVLIEGIEEAGSSITLIERQHISIYNNIIQLSAFLGSKLLQRCKISLAVIEGMCLMKKRINMTILN